MNLSTSMKQTKDLFTFPLSDPKWKSKLGIGTLLMFANFVVPIIPSIPLMGYFARLIRAGASNSDPSRLPEWEDWGDLFLDGLRMLVTSLIFSLPGIVIMVFGYVIYMIGMFSMNTSRHPGSYEPNPFGFFFPSLIIFFVTMGIGIFLSIIGSMLMQPAMAHVAVKQQFGALFEVGRWWGILKANFVGFLMALGVFMVVYWAAIILWQVLYFTIILCFAAPLLLSPLMVYATVLLYRLMGQAYGDGRDKLAGAAAPTMPDAVEPPVVDDSADDTLVDPAI